DGFQEEHTILTDSILFGAIGKYTGAIRIQEYLIEFAAVGIDLHPAGMFFPVEDTEIGTGRLAQLGAVLFRDPICGFYIIFFKRSQVQQRDIWHNGWLIMIVK